MLKSEYLQNVYTQVVTRDPDQKEFHQAVLEVLASIDLIIDQHVAQSMARQGSPTNRVLSNTYGARPALASR